MRKALIGSYLIISLLFFSIIINSKSTYATSLPRDTLQFYSKNNILYYNPLGSVDCYSGSSATLSEGNTYEEKIWNYFVNKKIPGVSDNAAVIAGIMANLKQESGYDPFLENSLGYAGLYQGDTKVYKTFLPIKNKVTQSVGDLWFTGNVGKVDSHPQEQTLSAIIIELDALTTNTPVNNYYGSFQTFIKNLSLVTNKTPSSYAELFQVEVERGVCRPSNSNCNSYSQPITDSGVLVRAKQMYKSQWGSAGYDYQGMHERMQKAEEIYDRYASNSTPPVDSPTEVLTTTNDCFHSSNEIFTHYNQKDDAYSSKYYDSSGSGGIKSSIYDSGCGPFSFTMLANVLGKNIDPVDVTKKAGSLGMHVSSGGSSHEITQKLAEAYELIYEKVNTGFADPKFGNTLTDDEITKVIDIINKYLKEGWVLHTSGTASDQTNTSTNNVGLPFTKAGHYIGIRGITQDGQWLIVDSNGKGGTYNSTYNYYEYGYENSKKTWDPATLIKAGMNIGNIHAIRASTTSTCGNITTSSMCGNTGNQALLSGGMTLEQAQVYMESYKTIAQQNSSQLISDYKINVTTCSGGSFYNCVAFTQYFIATNTSTGPAGGLPDGKSVVQRLIYLGLATDGGHTPQVYAVFSRQSGGSGHGHTGIVLGITDTDIIIGEADCYGGPSGIKAKTISLSTAMSDNYSYAYLKNLSIGE